jgi:hypothetical protein
MFATISLAPEEVIQSESQVVSEPTITPVEQISESQALPLPEGGLPEGWTQEQWGHYGHQYVEAQSSHP